jgi:pyrrolysine biosynthesis protein PylD
MKLEAKMTRLINDWIKDISDSIGTYEDDLISKTGMGYLELASATGNISKTDMNKFVDDLKIAVIPVTTGLGVIGRFSQSVFSILEHMGFNVFITKNTDVDGIYEANLHEADILFMADDDRFIAINLKENIVADNSIATAAGFVTAAEGYYGNLDGKEVLIAGYGNVGSVILRELKKRCAIPFVYEINKEKYNKIIDDGGIPIEDKGSIVDFDLIIDATNAGSWIEPGMLKDDVIIVSPGVPVSLDKDAYKIYGERMLHDYLPIGVATMAGMVCK